MTSKEYLIYQKKQEHNSKEKELFYEIIFNYGFSLILKKEYKFLKDRKYRFDIAIPDLQIAFEYEGIIGKSGHTTIAGYTNNAKKYNLAQFNGWKVYRFTTLDFNKKELQKTKNFLAEIFGRKFKNKEEI